MLTTAWVTITNDRIYIPTTAKLENGPYMNADPVFVMNFDAVVLARALDILASHGHPILPDGVYDAWDLYDDDSVLQAAGIASRHILKKESVFCGISWSEKVVSIRCCGCSQEESDIPSSETVLLLPVTSSMLEIAQAIVIHVQTLPMFCCLDARTSMTQ